MRKVKIEALKAERAQITLPRSFVRFAQPHGVSPFIQELIAYRILGVSRAEFRQMYSNEADIRFKPEPIEKAYIRAARWILESVIHSIWQLGSKVWLEVEWTVTGNRTICEVDLNLWPGFRHVVYDEVRGESSGREIECLSQLELGLGTLTTGQLFKWRILNSWIAYSYKGAANG